MCFSYSCLQAIQFYFQSKLHVFFFYFQSRRHGFLLFSVLASWFFFYFQSRLHGLEEQEEESRRKLVQLELLKKVFSNFALIFPHVKPTLCGHLSCETNSLCSSLMQHQLYVFIPHAKPTVCVNPSYERLL